MASDSDRIVRDYLEALQSTAELRRIGSSEADIDKLLSELQQTIQSEQDVLRRVTLVNRRRQLEAAAPQLRRLTELEAAFTAVVADWSAANHIEASTFQEFGVPVSVLRDAGLMRLSKTKQKRVDRIAAGAKPRDGRPHVFKNHWQVNMTPGSEPRALMRSLLGDGSDYALWNRMVPTVVAAYCAGARPQPEVLALFGRSNSKDQSISVKLTEEEAQHLTELMGPFEVTGRPGGSKVKNELMALALEAAGYVAADQLSAAE